MAFYILKTSLRRYKQTLTSRISIIQLRSVLVSPTEGAMTLSETDPLDHFALEVR